MSNNKDGLPNPGEVNKHVVNPAGWLFNGRFYKSLDDLAGRTMSEENIPRPLYTDQQLTTAYYAYCIQACNNFSKAVDLLKRLYNDLSRHNTTSEGIKAMDETEEFLKSLENEV